MKILEILDHPMVSGIVLGGLIGLYYPLGAYKAFFVVFGALVGLRLLVGLLGKAK